MRKLITITCLLALIIFAAKADNFYLYVSDSGHNFYFHSPTYDDGGREITWDEAYFLNAQGIYIYVESKNPNFDVDAMRKEARAILRDSLIALYEQNKDYMWEHFPEHRYTLEEFLEVIKKHTFTGAYYDFFNIPCEVESELDLRIILQCTNRRKRLEQHPYILGYLYKKVKFHEGERCKLQEIEVDYILFQNMPGQMFDIKNQRMIPANI